MNIDGEIESKQLYQKLLLDIVHIYTLTGSTTLLSTQYGNRQILL